MFALWKVEKRIRRTSRINVVARKANSGVYKQTVESLFLIIEEAHIL
jgi:hypothetical protein